MTNREAADKHEEIDCGHKVNPDRLLQNAPKSGDLTIPGHPKTALGRTLLPQQAAVPRAQRKRESSRAVPTHSPHIQELGGNPLGSWTDAHPKRKREIAFLLF